MLRLRLSIKLEEFVLLFGFVVIIICMKSVVIIYLHRLGPAIKKIKVGTIASICIESSMGLFDYLLKEKAGMIIAEQLKKF